MQTSELIKTNTTLQESLTKENEKYYGNLLIYVRGMALFRDEKKSEELLLEVLQDVLDAQDQGVSAEEYFGENPKKTADEIIKQLPINLFDTVKIFLTSLGIYGLICILPELIFPEDGVDIGRFAVTGSYWVLLVIFTLWLLGMSLYQFKNKLVKSFFILLVAIGVVLGFILNFYISTPIILNLSGMLGVLTIIVVSGFLLLLFYKENDKKMWWPFIPILTTSAVLGILIRLNVFSSLLNSREGKIGIAVILGIVLFIQYVLIFLNNRRVK
ncbi:DUF1129 domain-containing protein [Carnobacterium mobile]|uniref:hypothetical protein n=1 Tax=Carnobacterium mobile TaxID=2750 RepID=UPI0018670FD6|nr:hypothetical protein [Carnobacterium mobile]